MQGSVFRKESPAEMVAWEDRLLLLCRPMVMEGKGVRQHYWSNLKCMRFLEY